MTIQDGRNDDGHPAADENTPLLVASDATASAQPIGELVNGHAKPAAEEPNGEPTSAPPEGEDDTPLPKGQIFLLCYCSLIEPIAYFSIFPFISQMIKETGDIPEENVGFWSGTIESLFSLTQMVLMIFYGRAADRLGRKPVLVFSLTGITFATALFGMSKTLWQMIMFRCLAGVFAGSVVTVRALITENCTAKTQARAFSFYAFTRNLGIFLGPLVGGALSKPADQYPSLFGSNHFLKDYPYALPTFTTGALSASATILSALFVKETLNRKTDGSFTKTQPMSTWEIVKSPGVVPVLYIFSHTMLLGLAFTAIVPVFFFTQPRLGGYGLSPQLISIFMAITGGSQALWILIAFPPLQRRFSTGLVLRACTVAWPIFFVLFPFGNELLRHGAPMGLFWTLAATNSAAGSGVSMAFTCVQLALNDIAPSSSALGTLNALALTVNSAIRAVAPALFSTIFASGVRMHVLDGHLVWVILIIVALGLTIAVRWLPEKAEGRVKRDK